LQWYSTVSMYSQVDSGSAGGRRRFVVVVVVKVAERERMSLTRAE
jgi:hypothetical protein